MRKSIKIQNLKCGGCASTIKTKLAEITNIEEIEIDISQLQVDFSYTDEASIILVEQKLTSIGYPPVGAKNNMVSKAKSMISCATGKL
ncbi:cation transporter [Gillisia sp. Q332]|uniref:cation transporter n=1 Tax=Gillisia xinjiangensis TaxID=3384765 RepID=UPI003918C6F5